MELKSQVPAPPLIFYGIQRYDSTLTATNNYAGGVSGTTSYDFSGTMTANYNISEDLTSDDNGGTGNLTGKAPTDQFVSITAGSEDLHLKAGSACPPEGGIGLPGCR
jgi:hypothetical protein